MGLHRAVRVRHMPQAAKDARDRDTHLTSLHRVEHLLQDGRRQIPGLAVIDREAHSRRDQAERREIRLFAFWGVGGGVGMGSGPAR